MSNAPTDAAYGKGIASHQPGDDGLPPHQRIPALWSVLLGTLLVVLDSSMMSVALPHMGAVLKVPAASSVWISNAYQLVAASLILSSAALADRIGPSRLFAAGLVIFLVASLGCALSSSFEALVTWRCLQGIGAAFEMSLGPSLNRRIFPSRLLGSGIGMVAMIVALALAMGPTFGGVMLAIASWRWLFLINLPIGGIALYMALRYLPRDPGNGHSFDFPGALLSVVMLAASVTGLGQLAHQGGSIAQPVAWLLVGALAAVLFIRRQFTAAHPLLPLSMFAEARFSLAALVSLLSFIAQTITLFGLPFLLQGDAGYSPLVSGLLFTPWPLMIMLVAPWAGRLADRMSAPTVALAGLLLFSLGLLAMALLSGQSNVAAWDVLWRSALCGIGFALFQSPNNRELMGSVPREASSRASGVQATVRTFAQSVGAALLGLALASGAPGTNSRLPVDVALWWAFIIIVMALVISLARAWVVRRRQVA